MGDGIELGFGVLTDLCEFSEIMQMRKKSRIKAWYHAGKHRPAGRAEDGRFLEFLYFNKLFDKVAWLLVLVGGSCFGSLNRCNSHR